MSDYDTADPKVRKAFESWVASTVHKRVESVSALMIYIFGIALVLEIAVDREEVKEVGGIGWVTGQLVLTVVGWAFIKWAPFSRKHPVFVVSVFSSIVAAAGGYFLGSLGGFEGPFFYSAYIIAPLLAFLPCDLGIRAAMTISIVGSFVVAYLAPHPIYLSYPLIHIPASYIVLGSVGSIALGHWAYKLARDYFVLSEMLSLHNTQLSDRVASKSSEVHQLVESLASARESERTDLARTLHDDLGQLIVGARMEITNLERRLVKGSEREGLDELGFLTGILEDLNQSSRSIVHRLREQDVPVPLETRIESLLKPLHNRYGLATKLTLSLPEVLSGQTDEAVFRTTQEALTNIVKHAKASTASVHIIKEENDREDFVVVTLKDNGIGFNEETTPAPSANGGWGLVGMRERIEELGGKLTIDTSSEGTCIAARIPFVPELSNPELSSPER